MKIGVVTFWQSKDNYGQHLQSFALQTYLKKMGHEPFLIRYKENPQQSAHFQLKNICKYVCHKLRKECNLLEMSVG